MGAQSDAQSNDFSIARENIDAHSHAARDSLENIIPQTADSVNSSDEDLTYSERTGELSNREILANAYEGMVQNQTESDFIQRYRQNIDHLNDLQRQREELGQTMRQQMFTKGKRDMDTVIANRNRMKILDDQITRMDKQLLEFEAAAPLKSVLDRVQQLAMSKFKTVYQEKLQQDRQNREDAMRQMEQRQDIRRNVRWIESTMRNPSNTKYVPDEMRSAIGKLCSLFLRQGAYNQQHIAEIRAIYSQMEDGSLADENIAYLLDEDILDKLGSFERVLQEKRLYEMSSEELQDVSDVVSNFRSVIERANALTMEGRRVNLEQLAKDVEQQLTDKGLRKNTALNTGALWRHLTEGMMTTEYFFLMKELLSVTHKMNQTNTNAGGWDATGMRDWLNSRIWNALPIQWRQFIVSVRVFSSAGSQSSTINDPPAEDKLWLPCCKDVGINTKPFSS